MGNREWGIGRANAALRLLMVPFPIPDPIPRFIGNATVQ